VTVEGGSPRVGVAFLLAQLGSHAAERFAARAGQIGVTPPRAGVLRALAASPGQSQQALAEHLGVPPSRLVALLDDLEQRGAVTRTPRAGDRRRNEVALTEAGGGLLADLGRVAREHDESIIEPLSSADRDELRRILTELAAAHGLTAGVHPGFRGLPR
jgi:DNA-binding MarR family transcriptional regulator